MLIRRDEDRVSVSMHRIGVGSGGMRDEEATESSSVSEFANNGREGGVHDYV